MHRGFKLDLAFDSNKYYQQGLTQFEKNKGTVKRKLSEFVGRDGVLNGTQLQSNWFPQIEADIFISHSHRDQRTAVSLAGRLEDSFGLKIFIDSCIWGYANDLLKLIDNDYCLNPGKETYSYEKRNQSTSHVHMMLSTALSMMIDKAECLFFLNTPNSIQTGETINKTKSPWIYNEISISKIIRKRKLSEYRKEITKAFSHGGRIDESAMFNYEVSLGHLQNLEESDLISWERSWKKNSLHEKYSLNSLYELFPVQRLV